MGGPESRWRNGLRTGFNSNHKLRNCPSIRIKKKKKKIINLHLMVIDEKAEGIQRNRSALPLTKESRSKISGRPACAVRLSIACPFSKWRGQEPCTIPGSHAWNRQPAPNIGVEQPETKNFNSTRIKSKKFHRPSIFNHNPNNGGKLSKKRHNVKTNSLKWK